MTWSEDVALIFLQFLYDPELIRYLLLIAKPIHNNSLFEEARLFHESLRMTREKRWALTKELSKQRKIHEMNSRVPITCTLPFNNIEWRVSCELIKSIHYIRKGFLRRKFLIRDNYADDVDLEIPLKVKCINLIFNDDQKGDDFRGFLSRSEIRECLDDFEIYQDIDYQDIDYSDVGYLEIDEETPFNELPYLLIELWCDGVLRSGRTNRIYKYTDNTDLYIQEIMN